MTMGPAPMIRIVLRSVRLGMAQVGYGAHSLVHHPDEAIEQITDVVRTGARLGMTLEAERGSVGPRDALQRPVEKRDVGHPRGCRQRRRVHREAVVLAGDEHLSRVLVLDGMVRAVMAEFHLHRAGAAGKPEQLMTEADAEGRCAGL